MAKENAKKEDKKEVPQEFALKKDLRIVSRQVDEKRTELEERKTELGQVERSIALKGSEEARLDERIGKLHSEIEELEARKRRVELELDAAHELNISRQ